MKVALKRKICIIAIAAVLSLALLIPVYAADWMGPSGTTSIQCNVTINETAFDVWTKITVTYNVMDDPSAAISYVCTPKPTSIWEDYDCKISSTTTGKTYRMQGSDPVVIKLWGGSLGKGNTCEVLFTKAGVLAVVK